MRRSAAVSPPAIPVSGSATGAKAEHSIRTTHPGAHLLGRRLLRDQHRSIRPPRSARQPPRTGCGTARWRPDGRTPGPVGRRGPAIPRPLGRVGIERPEGQWRWNPTDPVGEARSGLARLAPARPGGVATVEVPDHTRPGPTVALGVPTARRGRLELGPLRVWIHDPFGLVGAAVSATRPVRLVVHPRPSLVPAVMLTNSIGPASTTAGPGREPPWAGDWGGDFAELRPYRVGDRLSLDPLAVAGSLRRDPGAPVRSRGLGPGAHRGRRPGRRPPPPHLRGRPVDDAGPHRGRRSGRPARGAVDLLGPRGPRWPRRPKAWPACWSCWPPWARGRPRSGATSTCWCRSSAASPS